ncbi:MAG: hypothetical protein QM601_04740 [Pseudoxanthomonas sp.]
MNTSSTAPLVIMVARPGACAATTTLSRRAALEIVGDLVELARRVRINALVPAARRHRLVQRVADAGLQAGVVHRQAQHLRRRPALRIDSAVQLDHAVGQGAGLVGAQHVHAAEVLDRVEALDDHPFARHRPRAVREGDRQDRRQQLRRQPHRQRGGEQQGVDGRPVQEQVDRQHRHHHAEHQPHQQGAEAVQAALELGFRRAQPQPVGDAAEHAGAAGVDHHRPRAAAAQRGAHEHAVVARGQCRIGRAFAGPLLHRQRLAGQDRLVDEAVACLQYPRIGRHQVAGRKLDDVPRHHLLGRDRLPAAVADHVGRDRDPPPQRFHRGRGAVFLDEAEHRGQQHDGEHDPGVGPFVHQQRHRRGDQQDDHQRIGEAAEQQPRPRPGPAGGQRVRPEPLQAFARRARGQAFFVRIERVQDLGGRSRPVAFDIGHPRAPGATGPLYAGAHAAGGRDGLCVRIRSCPSEWTGGTMPA